MAYSTGAANTPSDLLDAVQIAALASGWTLDHRGEDTYDLDGGSENEVVPTDPYRQDVLWVNNGSMSAGFSYEGVSGSPYENNGLRTHSAVSYDPNYSTLHQPSGEVLIGYLFYVPCIRYHIFHELDYIYVVLESEINHFRHFGFGQLTKTDDYVGGKFFYNHTYSSANLPPWSYASIASTLCITVGCDGVYERWHNNYSGDITFPGRIYGGLNNASALTHSLQTACKDQFNRQTILLPIYCSIMRAGGFQSPIGYPRDVRAVNMSYLSGGDIVTLGADTWRIFPLGKKGSSTALADSGDLGIALKV